MVYPSAFAFFDLCPALRLPGSNRLGVALTGLFDRLLQGVAHLPQNPPHMPFAVAHPQLLLDHLPDTPLSPDRALESARLGSRVQDVSQLGPAFVVQARRFSWYRARR